MTLHFDAKNGFLPLTDPLQRLSAVFEAWENTANSLPKWLLSSQFRQHIEALPEFPIDQLHTPAEFERAMLILSFIGHAYVWGMSRPPHQIPHVLAKPWHDVALALERPPVLSYASYALNNWRRIDPAEPVALGNIALLQNFRGGVDEEWFVLVHIDIECRAAAAIRSLLPAEQAAHEKDCKKLLKYLDKIATSLESLCSTMDRMPEHCDPYIYYNRVRPYIHAWKNNPALPDGLVYENVYGNQPQFFRGETGAQSTIVPALDAVLGVTHQNDELRIYLQEMRDYMPAEHRRFLDQLEANQPVRACVIDHHQQMPELRDVYNRCIDLVVQFRMTHLHYAASYIHKQSEQSHLNPNSIGTGGTPFMRYLKKHEAETESFRI